MCGFFGIVGSYDPKRAQEALSLLAHRGPDSCGIVEEPGLFLGHHRLYILDPKASQPMKRGGSILAFNGEIYNYQAFHPTSDTAAILEAFKRYGKEFVKRLEGMFALALWDGSRLLLARDIFGKKPIYYAVDDGRFIFASEIKAILAYTGKKRFNQKALSGYLSYGALPDSKTFYEGIYKLPARHLLIYDGKVWIERYESLLQKEPNDLETLIEEAVAKRLQGDFEVASLLSGGIDSSLVSALAKKWQGRLATFSIGYEEGRYSELVYAREVAEHIGSEHYEVIFKEDDFWATFEKALDHFDEPIGDSASLPLWFLMEEIGRQGFRVVLSGEGGDEIFLGYRQYFEMADLLKAKDLKYKNWLKNYFKANFSPNKEWEWYKRIWSDEVLFRSSCEVFTDLQKRLFLRQNVRDGESLEYLEDVLDEWRSSGWEDDLAFFTLIDLKVRLEALYLAKLDMVSMAHSIEARTPLLDRHILFRALSDPRRSKSAKNLLKKIAKDHIPPSILKRKKRGFSYPHMEWIKKSGAFEKMVALNKQTGFFRSDQIDFLVQNAKRNRFARHFWLVFAFLKWYERSF